MEKLARKIAMIGAGMSKFGQHFPLKRNPDLWDIQAAFFVD